ncbi:hypothetical protein HDU97_004289 [Phlyctochytrium planicorne]|nr:hypothetical protein HDU97_004289 [Phlyctochytrium planicorne]
MERLPIELLAQILVYLDPRQVHITFPVLNRHFLSTVQPGLSEDFHFTTRNLLNACHPSLQNLTLFAHLSLPLSNIDILKPLRNLSWIHLPPLYLAALFYLLGFGSRTVNCYHPEYVSQNFARPKPVPDPGPIVNAVVIAVRMFTGSKSFRKSRNGWNGVLDDGAAAEFPVLTFVDTSLPRSLAFGGIPEWGPFDHILKPETFDYVAATDDVEALSTLLTIFRKRCQPNHYILLTLRLVTRVILPAAQNNGSNAIRYLINLVESDRKTYLESPSPLNLSPVSPIAPNSPASATYPVTASSPTSASSPNDTESYDSLWDRFGQCLNAAFLNTAENGNLASAKVLLSHSLVDPTASEDWAIVKACMRGHAKIVDLLLSHQRLDSTGNIVRVDAGAHRNLAVISAAASGNVGIVKRLVECDGVDPAADTSRAYQLACQGGHIGVMDVLERTRKVDPLVGVFFSLWRAAENGHVEVLRRLLDAVEGRTKEGGGAEVHVEMHGRSNWILQAGGAGGGARRSSIFNMPASNSSPPNISSHPLEPRVLEVALSNAARRGHVEVVKLLTDRLGNVIPTSVEDEAISAACEHGHVEVVRMLVGRRRVGEVRKKGKRPSERLLRLLRPPVERASLGSGGGFALGSGGMAAVGGRDSGFPDWIVGEESRKVGSGLKKDESSEEDEVEEDTEDGEKPLLDLSAMPSSPLDAACSSGNPEMVAYILSLPGCNPAADDNEALVSAVRDLHGGGGSGSSGGNAAFHRLPMSLSTPTSGAGDAFGRGLFGAPNASHVGDDGHLEGWEDAESLIRGGLFSCGVGDAPTRSGRCRCGEVTPIGMPAGLHWIHTRRRERHRSLKSFLEGLTPVRDTGHGCDGDDDHDSDAHSAASTEEGAMESTAMATRRSEVVRLLLNTGKVDVGCHQNAALKGACRLGLVGAVEDILNFNRGNLNIGKVGKGEGGREEEKMEAKDWVTQAPLKSGMEGPPLKGSRMFLTLDAVGTGGAGGTEMGGKAAPKALKVVAATLTPVDPTVDQNLPLRAAVLHGHVGIVEVLLYGRRGGYKEFLRGGGTGGGGACWWARAVDPLDVGGQALAHAAAKGYRRIFRMLMGKVLEGWGRKMDRLPLEAVGVGAEKLGCEDDDAAGAPVEWEEEEGKERSEVDRLMKPLVSNMAETLGVPLAMAAEFGHEAIVVEISCVLAALRAVPPVPSGVVKWVDCAARAVSEDGVNGLSSIFDFVDALVKPFAAKVTARMVMYQKLLRGQASPTLPSILSSSYRNRRRSSLSHTLVVIGPDREAAPVRHDACSAEGVRIGRTGMSKALEQGHVGLVEILLAVFRTCRMGARPAVSGMVTKAPPSRDWSYEQELRRRHGRDEAATATGSKEKVPLADNVPKCLRPYFDLLVKTLSGSSSLSPALVDALWVLMAGAFADGLIGEGMGKYEEENVDAMGWLMWSLKNITK